MPATDSIEIYKGEDVTLSFTMNPVVDITGWTLEFNIEQSGTVVLTKSASVTDGPNGLFSVSLTDADTDGLANNYTYDVWRTDDGSESVLAIGNFIVHRVARDVS